jgi:cytoskeletal protein CcmA (bactofilin family)
MRSPKLPSRMSVNEPRSGGARAILPQNAPALPTTIARGVLVNGDVFAEQDVVLAGKIDGSLDRPTHALTVSPGGQLEGPAFARIVSVAGTIRGDVTASELVEILPGARVSGDITAPRVYLDEQARFQGKIDMRRADAAVSVARYRLDQRRTGATEPAKH